MQLSLQFSKHGGRDGMIKMMLMTELIVCPEQLSLFSVFSFTEE